jgi:hypothetical protein
LTCNGFQSLGVGAGRFLRSLLVGKAAVTFEDGVVGAADFVEEAQGVLCSVSVTWPEKLRDPSVKLRNVSGGGPKAQPIR